MSTKRKQFTEAAVREIRPTECAEAGRVTDNLGSSYPRGERGLGSAPGDAGYSEALGLENLELNAAIGGFLQVEHAQTHRMPAMQIARRLEDRYYSRSEPS
jgi:hypothetical protein